MPPLPVKSSGVIFERAARKLGWHPFPAPMAILSQPRAGRSACVNCGFCLAFGCEVGAKSSSLAAAIPVAEKTGRCEIRPNSYVHRIEMDSKDRATGAVYFDEHRNTHLQKAKAVIVCANGAETPRLLLLSANKQFPNGLANSSGIVGKYLMLNSGGVATGVFDHPLNDYKGFAVSRVLHDFYELDQNKVGFYGGGGLDARFDITPVAFSLGSLPPGTPSWRKGFKDTFAHHFTRPMGLFSPRASKHCLHLRRHHPGTRRPRPAHHDHRGPVFPPRRPLHLPSQARRNRLTRRFHNTDGFASPDCIVFSLPVILILETDHARR